LNAAAASAVGSACAGAVLANIQPARKTTKNLIDRDIPEVK
jgi:hypothetical protein